MGRTTAGILLAGIGALLISGCGNQVPNVIGVQTGCGATHPKVGRQAVLRGYLHGIRGTATMVDDCTIVIENFSYDGIGLDVRVVGARADENVATGGVILTDNIRRVYVNETITVKLPAGVTLDDIDQIGIICKSFDIDFADGWFSAPN
jgi:hypothetical protein